MMLAYTVDEIRSRLGISTFAVYGKPLERADLEKVARAGICHLEILDIREQFQEEDPQSMSQIVAACKELGLSITSFHSRSVNFAQPNEAQRQKEIDRSKRMIDHLLSIGGRVWGTHVRIVNPETKESYYELAEHYQGQNLRLVIENMGTKQSTQSCIDWIDSIGHPQIGMLLDVGHERNAEGKNIMAIPGEPTRIIRGIGRRLQHIHLHDSINGHEHYPPFEEAGELQWVEVFSALAQVDYPGIFMFEPGPEESFSANPLGKVGQIPEVIVRAAN